MDEIRDFINPAFREELSPLGQKYYITASDWQLGRKTSPPKVKILLESFVIKHFFSWKRRNI